MPFPVPPAPTPSTHTGRAADNESLYGGDALPVAPRNLDLRCRMLEIEKRCAIWKSEEYRRLLEQFVDGVGHSNAAGQQSVASSSSRSAPSITGGPSTHQQQPRIVAHQDDGRARHQRTSAPSESEPPEVVQRGNQENRDAFAGIIARLCADNSAYNRTEIFRAAGVRNYKLTQREAACARKTPGIPWMTFTQVFGGSPYSERPVGSTKRSRGYDLRHFLCTHTPRQPFTPTRIGEPGVILSPPGTALHDTFHLLIDPSMNGRKTNLQYFGIYTTVNTPVDVLIDEWYGLPSQCRCILLELLRKSRPVRDIHARCTLRKRKGLGHVPDPGPAEIRQWLRRYNLGSEVMEIRAIHDAFDSGAEKFCFQVIKCIGYNERLAELIQNGTNRGRV